VTRRRSGLFPSDKRRLRSSQHFNARIFVIHMPSCSQPATTQCFPLATCPPSKKLTLVSSGGAEVGLAVLSEPTHGCSVTSVFTGQKGQNNVAL